MQLGHDGPPTFFWTENLLTGSALARCPLREVQLARAELQAEIIRWKEEYFPHFRAGHLLVAGGISAQPARWLAAMRYLEMLSRRQEERYNEIMAPARDGGGT